MSKAEVRTEDAMRTKIWVLMLWCAAFTTGALPAAARDYPFCIKGCDFGGNGDCIFTSYQQCQASASGRDASCGANPYFNAPAYPRPNQGRRSGKRF